MLEPFTIAAAATWTLVSAASGCIGNRVHDRSKRIEQQVCEALADPSKIPANHDVENCLRAALLRTAKHFERDLSKHLIPGIDALDALDSNDTVRRLEEFRRHLSKHPELENLATPFLTRTLDLTHFLRVDAPTGALDEWRATAHEEVLRWLAEDIAPEFWPAVSETVTAWIEGGWTSQKHLGDEHSSTLLFKRNLEICRAALE